MELTNAMKERWEFLKTEKEKIDAELKGVESYLESIGELTKKRGRKPKENND